MERIQGDKQRKVFAIKDEIDGRRSEELFFFTFSFDFVERKIESPGGSQSKEVSNEKFLEYKIKWTEG